MTRSRTSPTVEGDLPTSMAVQVVLYDSDPADQRRLAAGIAAAVRQLRDRRHLDRVAVRYGDCSRWPCLTDADMSAIADELDGATDEVTFTFFDVNLGSAGGSNALAALGTEDVIWILNPDTYPSPMAGCHMLQALVADGVGASEGRQIPIEHPKDFDPVTGETSWASGCCLMVRREAFDDVGGFDAHFFPMYCDDVDLSWRLRASGWSIRHEPRAVIVHDKPVGGSGAVRWTEFEARSSHLARLWLYRRFGRRDLEAGFIESVDPDTDPVAADAIAEFDRRVAVGDEPQLLDGAAAVAEFHGQHYGRPRFDYVG